MSNNSNFFQLCPNGQIMSKMSKLCASLIFTLWYQDHQDLHLQFTKESKCSALSMCSSGNPFLIIKEVYKESIEQISQGTCHKKQGSLFSDIPLLHFLDVAFFEEKWPFLSSNSPATLSLFSVTKQRLDQIVQRRTEQKGKSL